MAATEHLNIPTYEQFSTFLGYMNTIASSVDVNDIYGDFAVIETSTTASHAYKVGDYLILNGLFYKVTTAITSGGTIVTSGNNANVIPTTVAAELENKVLVLPDVPVTATTGSIINYNDSRIKADHYVARYVFANSSAITEITSGAITTNGNITVSGTCTSATTAWIMLVR